jgi:tRNA(Ile)-lysidine synthase
VRYAWLAEVATACGAARTLTAHHRDDQAETVLLRLDRGSGLAGLAGIATASGTLRRPLLTVSRAELAACLAGAGLIPCDDPSNRDLAQPRNRVRHRLLSHLASREDLPATELAAHLASLAAAASRARSELDRWLGDHLLAHATAAGASLAADRLARLPGELVPFALGLLQRLAGAPYPASQRARDELARQLAAASGGRRRVGGAAGGGWHWTLADGRLWLTAPRPRIPVPGFTYTFAVPGDLVPPTAAFRLRLSRQAPAAWMWRQDPGSPLRAALALPLGDGDRVEVRNRRAGDRLQPLGSGQSQSLRHLLINRRVPRETRDQLPLLVVNVPGAGERIAWVPGVTIDERFRLPPPSSNDPAAPLAWVAEVLAP